MILELCRIVKDMIWFIIFINLWYNSVLFILKEKYLVILFIVLFLFEIGKSKLRLIID